jgi:6-phosphogluconolactonase (cycloisomerase 2 family)
LGDSTISAFQIDSSGGLTPILPDVATGSGPFYMATEPWGRFFYTSNYYDSTISGFSIDSTSGALTAVGEPTPTEDGPLAINVLATQWGLFAYEGNDDEEVDSFAVDPVTGALTSANPPYPGSLVAFTIAADPFGPFLYIATGTDAGIMEYSVDPKSGALTYLSSVAEDKVPFWVSVDISGKFLYMLSDQDATLYVYGINQKSGLLTLKWQVPLSFPVDFGQTSMTTWGDWE